MRRYTTLDDDLRAMLLEQYGFEKVINREGVSDQDLELIKQHSEHDQKLQAKITVIQEQRRQEFLQSQKEFEEEEARRLKKELEEALEKYPQVEATSYSSARYKNGLRSTLESALGTAADEDRERIRQVLGK